MAIFQTDDQGFLVGKLIESNRDLLAGQANGMVVWKDIRTNVRNIARRLNGTAPPSTRVSSGRSGGVRSPTPVSASRGGSAGRGGARAYGGGQASPREAVSARGRSGGGGMSSAAAQRADALPQRASNGRFVAGGRAGGGGGGGGGSSDGPGLGGAIRGLSDRVGRMTSSLAMASDNVDPTLNAAKEVRDVVAPLGRGMLSMFGRSAERRKERWYQRIIKAVTPTKRLDVGGPAASGGGGGGGSMFSGMMGGFGAMLKGVPAMLMGLFTRILMPVAALWGSFELGKWVGGKIYEWLDKSGMLPKIFDAFDSIAESFKSTWASVSGGMQAAWTKITDGFQTALSALMGFPDKIGSFFTGLDNAMRKIPVLGAAYGAAVDAAKSAVQSVTADAKAGYSEGRDGRETGKPTGFVQAAARDVGKVVNVASAAKDWVLGQTSKLFESGKGGAGTVSTGKGDFGGASYGTYQLSSKTGTLSNFLKQSPYGEQFAGLKPGSPEFNAKWKEVAKNDPNFGAAQHDFIKATHYDPMVAGLKKDGIDISGRGAAVQDAAWSTSVQFGGNSKLIQKALAGKDASKMSDAELVTAIQDYKAANNDTLFKNSSASVRAGTLARAGTEKSALLALNSAGMAATSAPVVSSVPSTSIPATTPKVVPPPTEVKAPPTQLNSNAGAGRGVVIVGQDLTGQNVSDRGIAHIVTGGLGG